MSMAWRTLSILIVLMTSAGLIWADCIPRSKLRDRHVVTYTAYNGTLRGCEVSPNFYTQQHKQGRGNLARKFIIDICEGEPRTSPRRGSSFEICTGRSRPDPKMAEED